METLKVSVMVPTYNHAAYILRAINSVLEQSYLNIELIIADDCSTDATESVVSEFLLNLNDSRIRYIRNTQNLGILRNYHQTLLQASGDLVVNLDGDDFFINSDFLKDAVSRFEKDDKIVLVFGDYCEFYQSSNTVVDIINHDISSTIDDKRFFEEFSRDKITWNHNSIV